MQSIFTKRFSRKKNYKSQSIINKILESKEKLGLDPNEYNFDEDNIVSALQHTFQGEIIHTQYSVQNKILDLYFPKRKIGIEID